MIDLWRGSLVVVAASFIGAAVACAFILWWAGLLPSLSVAGTPYAYCNILRVPVYGSVVTIRPETLPQDPAEPASADPLMFDSSYAVSSEIEDTLRAASADPSIRGLLIDVDSGGGGSVAGDEIAKAIRRFGRPSVSVIHEVGASSGYLVASAADMIFASEVSTIGSIGTTYSYADYSKQNAQEGITFHQLSSGPYKDILNPDKPLTEAERALIMRNIKIDRDNFVERVAEYRHQPIENIDALADGSAMLGEAALESGLIDQIGGTEEALAYLEQAIGEPAAVCW